MPQDTTSVYANTYHKVMAMIRSCDSGRLPPETELARQLGVSRITIRDILAEFEAQGFITRRRKLGTVINRHIVKETARLDIENLYLDMIRNSGFVPSCNILSITRQTPSMAMAGVLDLLEADPVYKITKILRANGQPVIFINDYIPAQYFHHEDLDLSLLEKSTYAFIQRHYRPGLVSTVSHLDTNAASDELALLMQVESSTPILELETVAYDAGQHPMVYTLEYINTKVIPFSIQRRLFGRDC